MFEWCSMTESTISSPGSIMGAAKLEATRFSASVDPLVKMISSVEPAFRKARAFSRASSKSCVAAFER
jgi:3-hydroxymyristoyl/3-hydroxydecanoyl-(acyl carrier protein) dehydratase